MGSERLIRPENASRTLVEVTGIAGSGKSTVTSLLIEADYTPAKFISARDPEQITLFLRSLPQIAGLIAENVKHPPRMTWADFKLVVYVSSWDDYLNREAPDGTLIFDQGPLYALVRLRAKGLGVAKTPAFAEWWSRMLGKWLDTMSLVVWLDADDDVLLGRVNQRDRSHDLKGVHLQRAKEFIHLYRTLFTEVEAEINRRGNPAIHRIDTGHSTAEEAANEVIAAVASLRQHTS